MSRAWRLASPGNEKAGPFGPCFGALTLPAQAIVNMAGPVLPRKHGSARNPAVCQNLPVRSGVDLVELRGLLSAVPARISDVHTHKTLAEACTDLGLPDPPNEGTKYERAAQSLADAADADLPEVARRVLARLWLPRQTRMAVEDLLWAGLNPPAIPKRTRREIARSLDLVLAVGSVDGFMRLLDQLWIVDDPLDALVDEKHWLSTQIIRHVFNNPGDWTTEYLFERVGAFEGSDRRFALFLEGMCGGDVALDETVQRSTVAATEPHLRHAGLELREIGTEQGYPLFALVSIGARTGRPKNLIFASSTKPDLRFSDAIDNDIEVLDGPDKVLVYDRPIGPDGLRWRDLHAWWKDKTGSTSDTEAKNALYARLRRSLPPNSPPQDLLFTSYHQVFGSSVPELPALLPEVWLHWDPKTVRERGVHALLQFRMDFLLLLPRGQRVVLEVDGEHHYARDGKPDPGRYARTVQGDRNLKLAGYEVFRFGGAELQERNRAAATDMLRTFFLDLFRRYGVSTPGS